MKKAPIPVNDKARVAELHSYKILDSAQDDIFDEFAKIASFICQTPIALISFIDNDKQWFKGKFGIEGEEVSAPRDISFCAHTINSDEVMVVENALEDEKFRDNPYVVDGMELRFYAGAPIISPDGFKIGSLCIVDRKAKKISEIQKEMLKSLSKQVMSYVELNLNNIKLENVQKQFEEVQSISSAGYWELDLATGKTIWSKEIYHIYNLPPNTPMNKIDGLSYYAEHDQARLGRMIEDSIKNKAPFSGEFDFIDAKGTKKTVRSKGYPVLDGEGNPIQLIGTFQDISALANAVMREKELVEQSKDAILTFDSTGRKLTSANKAALNLFKIPSVEEFKKTKLTSLAPEFQESGLKTWEQAEKFFDQAMTEGTASFEFTYKDRRGSLLYCDVVLSKITIANESFVQAIIRDVTKEKETQRERLFTLNAMKVGTWKWNILENDLYWNESNYKVFQIKSENFSGAYEAWEKTLHPEHKQAVVEHLQSLLADPNANDYEATFPILVNDKTFQIGARAQIIRDENKNAVKMIGINWDRTKEHETQLELEEQKKLAYHTSKLASLGTLAASVGHEINNPMAIIRGHSSVMSSLLASGNIDVDKLNLSLERIDNAVERATRIVKGLKSFSRSDQNKFDYFDVTELLQDTIDMFKEMYKKQKIDLTYDIPDISGGFGERGRLQQVLVNLITNAKDALEGQKEKKIHLKLEEKDDRFKVIVSDTGKGIPEEFLDKIFDPFFTSKDVNKGTGIGLAICYKIIKEHDSELIVRNLNPGAEFSFEIKRAIENVKDEAMGSSVKSKILIVDDEEDIRELIKIYISSVGYEPVEAVDGKDALEKYLASPTDFSAVITDLKMPRLTGEDLIQAIKNHESSEKPKLFVLSGGANPQEEKPDVFSSINGFVPKPFTMDELAKSLIELK